MKQHAKKLNSYFSFHPYGWSNALMLGAHQE
jgi:hypothetical protein